MSLELETLDQLEGGTMLLATIRLIYPSDGQFCESIHALLKAGDIRLLRETVEVPAWQWRELFRDGGWVRHQSMLEIDLTPQGADRIR